MTSAPPRPATLQSQARTVPHIVTDLPGPRARQHVAFDEHWTSPSLPRAYPFVPVRGRGLAVEDIDGNVFLDFAAGIAVNSTGHSHPRVVQAVQRQAAELMHYSASDFYLPIYAETARELARISPFGDDARVFIGNSGAEVVEASIKLARHATGRPYIVAFLGAFHGRTYGAWPGPDARPGVPHRRDRRDGAMGLLRTRSPGAGMRHSESSPVATADRERAGDGDRAPAA